MKQSEDGTGHTARDVSLSSTEEIVLLEIIGWTRVDVCLGMHLPQ